MKMAAERRKEMEEEAIREKRKVPFIYKFKNKKNITNNYFSY
jgi:hypothetical protein